MFENKNILITGGTGMIGSHLVQLLSDKANVRIVSHNRPVPPEINSQKIEILHGDLTEKAFAIKAVKGMDFVFHLAAYTGGLGRTTVYPASTLTPNLILDGNIIEAAKNENVDRNRGLDEILNSPVFKNFVISEDGTTTGIIVNIKEDKKIFVTNDLLLSIFLKLQHKEETQQETRMIMTLLKKFEIKKRIFSEYDYELKENSTDFKILTNYILLAAICAKKFQDNSNPKFLNTLLKLNDTICSQIDSINDVNNLSLIYYIINLELEYIRDLIRKTL